MNLYMVLFMLTTDLNNYRLSLIAGFFFVKNTVFYFFALMPLSFLFCGFHL